MTEFTVYPAIDLQNGRVVRLQQGLREQTTKYADAPGDVTKSWIEQGAEWLHVVNLDGSFGENSRTNINALREIIKAANRNASIQFGGGLRDLVSISHVLLLGVSRVIIGTAAVQNPDFLTSALNTFNSKQVILGVDAKEERVRISGWEDETDITPMNLIKGFLPYGLETVIYSNYSACEGIGVCGGAAKPPHHTPHPSAARLPAQLQFIQIY